eukprot:3747310-Amphidinium_carterae.1
MLKCRKGLKVNIGATWVVILDWAYRSLLCQLDRSRATGSRSWPQQKKSTAVGDNLSQLTGLRCQATIVCATTGVLEITSSHGNSKCFSLET